MSRQAGFIPPPDEHKSLQNSAVNFNEQVKRSLTMANKQMRRLNGKSSEGKEEASKYQQDTLVRKMS